MRSRGLRTWAYRMYPTSIAHMHAMTNGLLLPARSEKYATTTARIDAVIYIGIVKSCAVEDT